MRYSTTYMNETWSPLSKLRFMLLIEHMHMKAMTNFDLVKIEPKDYLEFSRKIELLTSNEDELIKFTERIAVEEQKIHHDTLAFVTVLRDYLGSKSDILVHRGLTSSDIVDTALMMQTRDAFYAIDKSLIALSEILLNKARQYKDQLILGRTHGADAEPESLGLKFLYWNKLIGGLSNAVRGHQYFCKMSGALGNYSNIDQRVEGFVASKLQMTPHGLATQVIPRQIFATYIFSLSLIMSTLEQISTDIRLKIRAKEFQEGFSPTQKGSSCMPHKVNPISFEQICGLARIIRGSLVTSMENIILWEERDISNSCVERLIFPEAFKITHYSIMLISSLIQNMKVNTSFIDMNIEYTHNQYKSQDLMWEMIDRSTTPELAYSMCQEWKEQSDKYGTDFLEIAKGELVGIISDRKIKKLNSDLKYLDKVQNIFKSEGVN